MNLTLLDHIHNLAPVEFAIGVSFFVLFILRTVYDLIVYISLILKKGKVGPGDDSRISIIMAIRNEEVNLKKNLPGILNINDSNFEVIVVDDFSQDQSLTVLGQLKESFPKLKISSINQETRYSTKLSQNIALKGSSGNWTMVFSPSINVADKNWLSNYRQAIDTNTEIIVGYSTVKPGKGLFNLLYRIELFIQQMNSFAFIKMGASYAINELNILFLSRKYFDHGGYRGEMSEQYANMELIINKFIHKRNTEILFSQYAKVVLEEEIRKDNFFELRTKIKHVKKKLSNSKRVLISICDSTKLLFSLTFVLGILWLPELILYLSIIVGIRIIIHALILLSALKRLNEQKIFIPSLVYELVDPYFRLFSGIIKSLPLKRK